MALSLAMLDDDPHGGFFRPLWVQMFYSKNTLLRPTSGCFKNPEQRSSSEGSMKAHEYRLL
jgi:hypothetical protein